MGCDLLVSVFEIGKKQEPNWDRAGAKLNEATSTQFREAFCGAVQLDPSDAWDVYSGEKLEVAVPEGEELDRWLAEKGRKFATKGLATLKDMWARRRRDAVVIDLAKSRVLIAGGTSAGDPPFEEYDEAMTAIGLGLLRAAGFWGQDGNGVRIGVV